MQDIQACAIPDEGESLSWVIVQSLNIILGDLNCDMLKQNNNAVSRLCQDYILTNIIKDPTCFKENPHEC